jgi:predicted metalloprotease with PDZ domain
VRALILGLLLAVATTAWPQAQAPVAYHLSFADRAHRLMDVEVTFTEVPPGPLQLRMSRTSPGRYALHEFAKNVFDVRITTIAGDPLTVTRPNPHQWDVTGHAGDVRVRYRVFGDHLDGTYLAVDTTHAHVNMPAALMWARGFELRPAAVRVEPPAGASWRAATQLFPGQDSVSFTAPNLQYLMDSPLELGPFAWRTFTVADNGRTPEFRLAVHHTGSDADVDGFARDVEAIVREMRHVFGGYPSFDANTYTFIVDLLPWANGDAMEHRNSTVITSWRALRGNQAGVADSVAHEFFHVWNVERIRPRSLEPFNLEEASSSGELWLAEGFTNYYGSLVMARAGVLGASAFADEMGRALDTVVNSPGRQFRSAVEVSQLAPFVDAATSVDETNFDNTFISYYTWGQAIALGLDLTLRDRSGGAVTLDDYMRAMWTRYGAPPAPHVGHVAVPYTLDDARRVLGDVAGDAAFAADFFRRYIEGREAVDYAPLLARAGILLRRSAPGRAFAGEFRIDDAPRGARISGVVPHGSPAWAAGMAQDDVIVAIDGTRVARAADVDRALGAQRPGAALPVTFERRGQPVSATLRLVEDPRLEAVLMENAGRTVSDAQRRFRDAWLGPLEAR